MKKTRWMYIVGVILFFSPLLWACTNREETQLKRGRQNKSLSTHTQENNEVGEHKLVRQGVLLRIEKKAYQDKILYVHYTIRNHTDDTVMVVRPVIETGGHIGRFLLHSWFGKSTEDKDLILYSDSIGAVSFVHAGPVVLSDKSSVLIAPKAKYVDNLQIDIGRTTYKNFHGVLVISCTLNLQNTSFERGVNVGDYSVFAGTITSNKVAFHL